jgi:hypothetical protein
MESAFSVLMTRFHIPGINTDLAFRTPRIISPGSRIFRCIAAGSVEDVREMLVKGEASVHDVEVTRGRSLLCVSRIYYPVPSS